MLESFATLVQAAFYPIVVCSIGYVLVVVLVRGISL